MATKAISARIDNDTLTYIKGCHVQVNTLINKLLNKWKKDRQHKELLIWNEETGQDEFSQMKLKNDIKCSQCCKNCDNLGRESTYQTQCYKTQYYIPNQELKNFCCIYWEHKKKGSR